MSSSYKEHYSSGDLISMFRSQVAIVFNKHIEDQKKERIISQEEQHSTEIAVRFLRTGKYNEADPKEKAVVDAIKKTYAKTVIDTIFFLGRFN